jgi:hypothetical protein
MERKTKTTLAIAIFMVTILVVSSFSSVSAGPKPKKECNDGLDNDGDGAIDLADAGCEGKGDNDETNCGDGVCEGGEDVGSCPADCGPSCSDTDGGFAPYVQGTVTYSGEPIELTDFCNGPYNGTANLVEYYCDEGGPNYGMHDCYVNGSMCVDGACV